MMYKILGTITFLIIVCIVGIYYILIPANNNATVVEKKPSDIINESYPDMYPMEEEKPEQVVEENIEPLQVIKELYKTLEINPAHTHTLNTSDTEFEWRVNDQVTLKLKGPSINIASNTYVDNFYPSYMSPIDSFFDNKGFDGESNHINATGPSGETLGYEKGNLRCKTSYKNSFPEKGPASITIICGTTMQSTTISGPTNQAPKP